MNLNLKVNDNGSKLLRVKVTDNGVGLTKNAIKSIIDGTSASTNGTDGEQGYGFGLSLVKHLVDNLNGSMYIYSEPGEGATFEVNLPQL